MFVKFLTGESLQSDDSSVCGHYCILFFLAKVRKLSFSTFAEGFTDQSQVGEYDNVVKNIVNRIIENSVSQNVSCARKSASCKCDPDQCCVTKSDCLKKHVM